MPDFILVPITDSDGKPMPPPEGDRRSHIPFKERMRHQTLLGINHIHRAANGYISLSRKLPPDADFNFEHVDGKSAVTKDKPLLLAVRIHLNNPDQLGIGGLSSIEKDFPDYWERLEPFFRAPSDDGSETDSETDRHGPLRKSMDRHMEEYFPGAWHKRRKRSMHGNYRIDLIAPCQQKGGRSPILRAHIPKQWSRLLLGRLTPEYDEDKDSEKIESLASVLKIDATKVNEKMRNKIQCDNCQEVFCNSRRAMFGHLEQSCGGAPDDWPIDNPIEPFVTVRKIDSQSHSPFTYKFDFMTLATKYRKKWFLSVPSWAKKHLLTQHPRVEISIKWHSPPIIETPRLDDDGKPMGGRPVTDIPTKWNTDEPGRPMEENIIAHGEFDLNSNSIVLHPDDNNEFSKWRKQGISHRMILFIEVALS
jgi:hypothetical protein